MKIDKILVSANFSSAVTGSEKIKKAFHTAGKAFLRKLANEVGNAETSSVSSCLGGPAVLGEVTLHSDNLYLSMFEGYGSNGVQILYRTCRGRKDSTGGQNRYVKMSDLANSPEKLQNFVEECKRMEEVGAIA